MQSSLARRLGAIALCLACSAGFAAPAQVAVLLPQSGRMATAATAIRDGLLAAYYQDTGNAPDSPVLHFYDSGRTDILQLLQQARADGATFVIGPLDRDSVARLAGAGAPGLPVLALNSSELQAPGLIQFALGPDDEIRWLAAWMHNQKISNPMLLVSSEDIGQREQQLFQAAWQQYQQHPLKVAVLDATRKGGIVAGIRDLASGHHDALFLASPALATQVLPALTYYHNTLPLYSLSAAWEPAADASGQKDLDGLHFCDMPWMLDPARPEQTSLYQALPRPSGGYDRLYAFGADAWTLMQHWQSALDGAALSLRSGLLQADTTGHIHRIPTCAEVSNGTATPFRPEQPSGAAAGTGG